ncbi:unnamed protein product [Thelazia callipaeda]|uniref:Epidermal growth factor receptor substrate 15-like 1 n=1 Tax=Thelazia callipaeda TaxID=103827 RepID=A0A0N5CWZ8_THECL|nr:unnamed protein product [Thelazia callipaeda]
MNLRGKDLIPAEEAAAFLKRSNLNVATLGQIWELADYNQKGCLDKTGAFIAFKLVAASQQGYPASWNSLSLKLGPPSFASRSATPSIPNFGTVSAGVADSWTITPADQMKYTSIFDGLHPVEGKVPGDKVRPVLLNSGLPSASLARIWELADMDKDGKLDRIEMCIALHLVYCALQGEPVPNALPSSLIHPTKRKFVQLSNVPPVSLSQLGGNRHRTSSVVSLENAEQPTHLSERTRSQSVQPTTVTSSTISPPPPFLSPATAWPVQTALYEANFKQADSNQDGYVSGADVREILIATGMPQNTLALLWSLVDLKKTGILNLEQFALIMHLIENHKCGKPIPYALSPNLIPPSFRSSEAPASALSSGYITACIPSENEELDALRREVENLILERREADQEIVQLEADMTVKNSEIKNLKIELSTLENTVIQLEKQKGEAEKRLETLDLQILHLERAVEQSKEKVKEEEIRLTELRSQNIKKDDNKQDEELLQAQREILSLEEEKKMLSVTVSQRNSAIENASLELTKLENRYAAAEEKAKRIEVENMKLKQAVERLTYLIENNDIEVLTKERNELFAVLLEISPVAGMEKFDLCPAFQGDPFAAAGSPGNGFGTDPFAGTNNTPFTNFDVFTGKDPFDSDNIGAELSIASAKAPPPRPAPPKLRQTPMESDPFSGTDPFVESRSTTVSVTGNFADFKNFDAFAAP